MKLGGSMSRGLVVIGLTMVVIAALSVVPSGQAGSGVRACGTAGPIESGTAEKVRADRVPCRRARRVAAQYLRFNDVSGLPRTRF